MEAKMKKETKKENIKIEILDFIRLILICFVFSFLCIKFVFRPVTVEGNSMYPTLIDQERGFSNVFSTYVSDIKRFEVVVVNYEPNDDRWVKRVVGLPGEKVEYKNNKLYINDEFVEEDFFDEAYVNEKTNNGQIIFSRDYGPYQLGDDEYFLVGDNRIVSYDSREVGPFKKEDIVSKYVLVLYPFDKIGVVSSDNQ
ncbi:signal peptidase I [Breznakia pachnodae]|uniref:Signal peptidase I n=1 Tax=Breznakia pachnodae TaxID=265178 RepID=A0ABU0E7Q4_9FIRM|nr:signal peptidase I [Breznakia pachnodae]MDQ0362941.1 signal peptidase I [Breznakia pachnodae]